MKKIKYKNAIIFAKYLFNLFFFQIIFTKLLNSIKQIIEAIINRISHKYSWENSVINNKAVKKIDVRNLFNKFSDIKYYHNFF